MFIRTLGLVAVFWSIAVAAQAQRLPIPEKTTGLSPIQGQITEVKAVRVPKGDTVTGVETRVTLKFKLAGCLDSLMPLISHRQLQGQRVTFYVTALNAHNEASKAALCSKLPETSAQVSVPGIFQRQQVQVVFLGQPPV